MSEKQTPAPISLVAVVQFNEGEALVLSRPIEFRYQLVGRDYIGSDGPFRSFLRYEGSSPGFVAFAGRELSLTMEDGSEVKIKNDWWHSGGNGYRDVTVSSIKELSACYVFSGASLPPEEFDAFRATYTSCVYPYFEYEKIIKWDGERMRLYDELFKLRKEAAKIEQLREALRDLLFAYENADETGYVADVGFMDIDAIQEQARAALAE